MHVGAVFGSWTIPANNVQASQIGFDLIGDGGVDNQLANFFVALPFASDFRDDLAASTDIGALIVLEDIEYWSGGAATVRLYRGTNPLPPACAGAADTICRRHLDGGASFSIASVPVPNAGLTGTLTNQNAQAAGDSVQLPLLVNTSSVDLPLRNARIQSLVGGAGILGGAVARNELENRLVPALVGFANAVVARDCLSPGMPPGCGCMGGSSGANTIAALDSVHDCSISAAELISLLPPPDLDVTGDGTPESLSLGIGFTTVRAIFSVP